MSVTLPWMLKNTDRILQSVLPVTVILISRTGYPSGGSLRTVLPPLLRTCHHPHHCSAQAIHKATPAAISAVIAAKIVANTVQFIAVLTVPEVFPGNTP